MTRIPLLGRRILRAISQWGDTTSLREMSGWRSDWGTIVPADAAYPLWTLRSSTHRPWQQHHLYQSARCKQRDRISPLNGWMSNCGPPSSRWNRTTCSRPCVLFPVLRALHRHLEHRDNGDGVIRFFRSGWSRRASANREMKKQFGELEIEFIANLVMSCFSN